MTIVTLTTIVQSGDSLNVRLALRNTRDLDRFDVEVAADPTDAPPGVVIDGGNLDYDAFDDIQAGECSWPRHPNSRMGISTEKWYAGSFCADVMVIYDGRAPTDPCILPNALCVTVEPEAWLDVDPNQGDTGVMCDESRVVDSGVFNRGSDPLQINGITINSHNGIGVTVDPPLPWGTIPPTGSRAIDVTIDCNGFEGPIDPPIEVILETDACFREDRQEDRLTITGLCSCGPVINAVPNVTSGSYPDISDNWIVWYENRHGNNDVFAYNTCTGEEVQVTSEQANQGKPLISGDLVVWYDSRDWDGNGQWASYTVYGFDLSRPELGTFPVDLDLTDGWSEDLVGLDDNLVALTRGYYRFTEQSNVDEASNLFVYEYLGNGTFSVRYATSFVPNNNHQPMQTAYHDGDFGDGLLVFERSEIYWETQYIHDYWTSRDQHIEVIDFAAGEANPRRVCSGTSWSWYSAAAHRHVYVKEGADNDGQIWLWKAQNSCVQLTASEFEPGDGTVAIGGAEGSDFIVYDYSDVQQRPGLYYMDGANGYEEGVLCTECRADDELRMDNDRVVWVDYNDGAKVKYAFLNGPECTSDLSCNDDNTCTTDVCENGCCSHAPNCTTGAECDDGLLCNGAETCSIEGCCQPGTDVDCNDGVGCTVDFCNEDTDSCDNIPGDGLCGDGIYCNGVEWCHLSNDCQAGVDIDCSDGIACTDDSCNEDTDECEHAANDENCDDGLFCNGAETCDSANGEPQTGCRAGTEPCPDGIPCTSDDCDDVSDVCPHDLTADTCLIAGSCYSNGAINPFHQCEVCDSTTDPNNWTPRPPDAACGDPSDTICDDPDTCDGDGTCLPNNELSSVECRQDAGDCDVPEFCDGAGSCPADAFEPPGTACDDPSDTNCDNPDTCDSVGFCQPNYEPSTVECRMDDGDCDVPEFCDGAGSCPDDGFEPVDTPCGDPSDADCDNPDSCDGAGICQTNHELDGTPCLDSLFCNGPETCQSGACADGIPPCPAACTEDCGCSCQGDGDCPDDGLACTTATCNLQTGCCEQVVDSGHCLIGGLCFADADLNLRNDCEACDPVANQDAWSLRAVGAACGDSTNAPCTDPDTCNSQGRCLDNHMPDGMPCDDDAFCNGTETCGGGQCESSVDPCTAQSLVCDEDQDKCWCDDAGDCDDLEACTQDTCARANPGADAIGCVYDPTPLDGATCDDGNSCTSPDTCAGGTCTGTPDPCCGDPCCGDPCCGNPCCGVVCDDGNECTIDSCVGGSCVYTPEPGKSCDDGNACTTSDVCNDQGICDGTPIVCNDVNPCTDDTCDSSGVCVFTPDDTNSCDDDDVCTGIETCVAGNCVSVDPMECDDENPCTDDSCDPATGCVFAPDDTNSCADDDACDGSESCEDGTCVDGTRLDCDDENLCTDDSCDSTAGCVFTADDTNTCADDDFCDGIETCNDGECEDGVPPCADDEVCDEDTEECKPDSDGDGIPDDRDDCPSTPADCGELGTDGCCFFTIVVETPSGQRQVEASENNTLSLWIQDTAQDCIGVCPELLDCLCVNKEDECDGGPCQHEWSGDGVTPENKKANPLELMVDGDMSVSALFLNCTDGTTLCPEGEVCCDGECVPRVPMPTGCCGPGDPISPCMMLGFLGLLKLHSRRRGRSATANGARRVIRQTGSDETAVGR